MRRVRSWGPVAVVWAAFWANGAAAQEASRVTPTVLAYRKARPAVVNISTEKLVTTRWGMLGRDIFEDIFPFPFQRQVPVQSLGSGFLVHRAGYIITNDHVVRRAQTISVTLADQSKHPAQIISSDPRPALAVIKIEPPKAAEPAYLPLGRSDDLMVGETVVAIGNPMGLQHTVTSGIVSALGRTLEFNSGVSYEGLIQTDAPINPGSSGGPLLNIRGELIGINTAIRGDAQNIGFAIPVDALMEQFPALLDFERINRAVFGAKVLQRHTADGDELYVAEVRPGTAAAKQLRVGDLVVELNGQAVRQIPDFTCAMLAAGVPVEARLKLRRDGKDVAATVAVSPKPRPDGKLLAQRLFGITFRPITPQLARAHRLPLDKGLLVVGLDADGPGNQIGLRLMDVIFQVERYYVEDLDSLGVALEDVRPGETIRLGVARGNVAARVQIRARSDTTPAKQPSRRPATGKGEA